MRIRLIALALVGAVSVVAQAAAQDTDPRIVIRDTVRRVVSGYQGRNRGPEQTESFSRKVKVGRDGRINIGNIAGDIIVTGGSGDEVAIEAVKRTRGDRSELAAVHINVDERGGRVDVRTDHTGRTDHVSVDYTITVPGSATVELHSISGSLKVSNVQGVVRMETVSGNVTTSAAPRVELAKSVSGDVDLTATSIDGELTASSLSGHVRARGVKARGLQLGSVSGDVSMSDVSCDRVDAKSLSGNVEFSGTLARSGRYDLHSHSGTVRLVLSGNTGFELHASSFSGSIRSEFPMTVGGTDVNGRRRMLSNRSMNATFGDGSAVVTVRTFSGDVVISKR
jgi:DUF4097 and DUF4098 domain-containing protein YvlB